MMQPAESAKFKINWRDPRCGGISVHGRESCGYEEGKLVCRCLKKPINFNYEIHFIIAQAVYAKKMYLDKNCDGWDSFVFGLFTTGSLQKFQQVQGKTIKERFFNTMMKEVGGRHDVGESAVGFETHPSFTPYDSLLLKMKAAIEQEEHAKKLLKEKKEMKKSSMLAHESKFCKPIVNMTKRTKAVVDDEGDELESALPCGPELDTSDSEDEVSPLSCGRASVTSSATKASKRRLDVGDDDEMLFASVRKAFQPTDEELHQRAEQRREEREHRERELALRREELDVRRMEAENFKTLLLALANRK